MNTDLFEQVRETIADVLDLDDPAVVTPATVADDIEDWDSLGHVRILTSLERRFGFRFTEAEITGLANVEELVDAVERKIAAGR